MTTTTASRVVYAIVGDDYPAEALPESGQGPLSLVAGAGLAAVVGDVSLDRPRRALEDHLRTVKAIAERGPALPMRFGLAAPDDSAITADLSASARRYRSLLDVVRGRGEFDLQLRYQNDSLLAAAVGERPRLRRLARRAGGTETAAGLSERVELGEQLSRAVAERRRRDALAVARRLQGVAAAVRIDPDAGNDEVRLACLVDRDGEDRFMAAVEEVAQAGGESLRVRCTGPLPAFSFMDAAVRERRR